MNQFIISAFADEISEDVNEQIRVLKENGIRHIEVRGLDGKNVSLLTLAEAQKYKELFDKEGIKVSSIGSPIGKIGINDDFAPHLELFKHVLKIADIFESPYVRMFSFFINKGEGLTESSEDPDIYKDEVIKRWKQFIDAAVDHKNITLLHENEKGIYGDTPERCLTLLQNLNTNKVRAVFDPANFVQCDAEVYPKAYEMLKDYVDYLHIKDAKFSDHAVTPAGYGDGCVEKVLEAFAEKGFSGFASIEPHLSMFKGFAELENKNISGLKEESDNVRLFFVAADALKKILVDNMKQEWK